MELFNLCKVNIRTNLQFEFRNFHNGSNTHPGRESREPAGSTLHPYDTPSEYNNVNYEVEINDSDCTCDHHTHNDHNGKWSLQDAISSTFEDFIDKNETVNAWECGLDRKLNTWKDNWFTHYRYDSEEEQKQRLIMINYAKNDCLAVSKLYFHMYPNGKNNKNINTYETPTTSINMETNYHNNRIVYINNDDEYSEISEDELIEILKPKFNKQKPPTKPQDDEQPILTINPTRDIEEFNHQEEQQQIQIQIPITTPLSKSEKQKKRNMKLKWKQKNRPDFKHHIIRPIYYKYDFRKIRAQLMDDHVYHSHQISINEKTREVKIVFKSRQEQERAKQIVKINYFSRNQYYQRWG
jgi:hypothetical protein